MRMVRLVGVLELELDGLAGELVVDGGEGVELVLEGGGVLGVEEDLVDAGAVGVLAHALAGDL